MFTGAPTAKVFPSANKDFSLVVRCPVQDEIRVLTGVRVFPESVEEGVCKPSSLQGLQELLWDDHICINVLHVQRCSNALQNDELFDSGG